MSTSYKVTEDRTFKYLNNKFRVGWDIKDVAKYYKELSGSEWHQEKIRLSEHFGVTIYPPVIEGDFSLTKFIRALHKDYEIEQNLIASGIIADPNSSTTDTLNVQINVFEDDGGPVVPISTYFMRFRGHLTGPHPAESIDGFSHITVGAFSQGVGECRTFYLEGPTVLNLQDNQVVMCHLEDGGYVESLPGGRLITDERLGASIHLRLHSSSEDLQLLCVDMMIGKFEFL